MEVRLITFTPNPVLLCARAGRVSHSKKPAEEQEMTEERAAEFIRRLISLGHESVIEHASFTFSVSGISRVCSHQLVRHRIASYTQRSQRYVGQEAEFVVPPGIPLEEEVKDLYLRAHSLYQRLLKAGARKEDARYVIPQGITTSIVITMNARELRHFFKLRLDLHAQWEIRALALRMFEEAYRVAPAFFEDLLPLAEKAREDLDRRGSPKIFSGKKDA